MRSHTNTLALSLLIAFAAPVFSDEVPHDVGVVSGGSHSTAFASGDTAQVATYNSVNLVQSNGNMTTGAATTYVDGSDSVAAQSGVNALLGTIQLPGGVTSLGGSFQTANVVGTIPEGGTSTTEASGETNLTIAPVNMPGVSATGYSGDYAADPLHSVGGNLTSTWLDTALHGGT